MRLDNRKVLRAPGPKTKHFERFFCRSINYNNNDGKTVGFEKIKCYKFCSIDTLKYL